MGERSQFRHMETLPRYSPFAWTTAVAVSACAWAASFKLEWLSLAAFWLAAIAIIAWIVFRWAGRFARTASAGESRELAVLRAISSFALAVFVFVAIAVHVWALGLVYPEPSMNRAYAESLGVELGPYLLASLAVDVVVAFLAFAAIRALRAPDPARTASLMVACAMAPVGWVALALALTRVVAAFKAQWSELGADLPSPVLLLLASEEYLGVIAGTVLALCVLAWIMRARPAPFRRIAVAQILLLLLCGAFFTMAVVSSVLPLFKLCGAV
jgi:hypothetical protein